MQEGEQIRVHGWCLELKACKVTWPPPQTQIDARDEGCLKAGPLDHGEGGGSV
jgi:hypothetical protein